MFVSKSLRQKQQQQQILFKLKLIVRLNFVSEKSPSPGTANPERLQARIQVFFRLQKLSINLMSVPHFSRLARCLRAKSWMHLTNPKNSGRGEEHRPEDTHPTCSRASCKNERNLPLEGEENSFEF